MWYECFRHLQDWFSFSHAALYWLKLYYTSVGMTSLIKKMVLLTDIAILFKSSRVRSCRSFRKKVYIWISSNICNYEFNVNKLLLLGLQGEISPLETSVLGCRREAQGETNLFVPRGSGEVQYCTVPSSKVPAEQGDLQLKQKLMFG